MFFLVFSHIYQLRLSEHEVQESGVCLEGLGSLDSAPNVGRLLLEDLY